MRALAVPVLLALASSAAAGEFRSIAESGATMYDAPSVRAKKLFVASRFYPVEIVINIDNWVKVRDQAGDLAWVEKKALSDKRMVIVTAAAGRGPRCRGSGRGRLDQGAPRRRPDRLHQDQSGLGFLSRGSSRMYVAVRLQ